MTTNVSGYVKAVSQNQAGWWSACITDGNKNDHWVQLGSKECKIEGRSVQKGNTVAVTYDENNWKKVVSWEFKDSNKSSGGNKQYNKGGNNSSSYTPKKRDNSGVEAGHCITAAYNFVGHKKINVLEEAKQLHAITRSVKAAYAAAHPDVSEYDVGASVGHAILHACQMLSKKKDASVEDVEALSKKILGNISGPILSYIREMDKEAEEKVEDKPFSGEESSSGSDDDDSFDMEDEDDIPF